MKTFKLLKTVPSHSHNAPFSAELGAHWPAGTEFNRSKHQTIGNTTAFDQIGGEEVIVIVPNNRLAELFGITS